MATIEISSLVHLSNTEIFSGNQREYRESLTPFVSLLAVDKVFFFSVVGANMEGGDSVKQTSSVWSIEACKCLQKQKLLKLLLLESTAAYL